MTRRLARGAAAFLMLATALGLAACGGGGSGGGGGALAAAPGVARNATDSAYAFLDGYVDPDGRVVRRDQGGDTVSEGQAYALLLAAGVGDQKRFDTIWTWTQKNLQQPNGLLAFRWNGGQVADPQPASDADLDAARALLVAGCRFGRKDLRAAALRIGRAVLQNEVAHGVLVAGPWATKPPITIDPSYYSPATLAALGKASGDSRYANVSSATLDVLAHVMRPLAPDWAVLGANGTVKPVDNPGGQGSGRSTFDAPRTILRLAESSDTHARRLAAKAWPVLQGRPDLVERQLNGRPAGNSHGPVGLVAAAAAADAAGKTGTAAALLARARREQHAVPTYYGGALVGLAGLMLETGRLRVSC